MALKPGHPMVVPHYKITGYTSGFVASYFTLAATDGARLPLVSGVSQLDAPLASLPTMFARIHGSGLEWFGQKPVYQTPTWPVAASPLKAPYRGVVLVGRNISVGASFGLISSTSLQSQLITALGTDLAANNIFMAYVNDSFGLPVDYIPADGVTEIAGTRSINLGGDAGLVTDSWDFTMPTLTGAKWAGYEILYIWLVPNFNLFKWDFVSYLVDTHFNSGLGKDDHYYASSARIEAGITAAKATVSAIIQGGIFSRVAGHAICVDEASPTLMVTNPDYTAGATAEAVAAEQTRMDLGYTIKAEIMADSGGTCERQSYIGETAADYVAPLASLIAAKVREFYSL